MTERIADIEILRGRAADALPRPGRTWRPGRVCTAEGCTTRLSVYNRQDRCFPHRRIVDLVGGPPSRRVGVA